MDDMGVEQHYISPNINLKYWSTHQAMIEAT